LLCISHIIKVDIKRVKFYEQHIASQLPRQTEIITIVALVDL